MKLRLAKASQLSWSWGLAWLSLAKMEPANKHVVWKVLNGKESQWGKVRWGVLWGNALVLDLGLSE